MTGFLGDLVRVDPVTGAQGVVFSLPFTETVLGGGGDEESGLCVPAA